MVVQIISGWFMSHVHFADGAAYAPSTFGETDSSTGAWKINTNPKCYLRNKWIFLFKDLLTNLMIVVKVII